MTATTQGRRAEVVYQWRGLTGLDDGHWRDCDKETFDANRKYFPVETRALVPADTLAEMQRRVESMQARIDELMLEYCPDEMTDEQRATWAASQRPSNPPVPASIVLDGEDEENHHGH